jgi:hypothetical protein
MYSHRIDLAITTCEQHIKGLDPEKTLNNEIEIYLVSGLVLLIVSEYEVHLESLFIRRADMCGDSHASSYIRNSLCNFFRSPDLGKINETLKRFDESYRKIFWGKIENSPHKAAWDSLMIARHAIVHKKSTLSLTFRELKENYTLTKEVILNVERALGLTAA